MVKVKEDLTGKIIGRLKVLEQAEDYIYPSGKHVARWLCECSCENHTLVTIFGMNLTRKNKPTQSCGCLIQETSAKVGREQKRYNRYDLSGEYGIGWTSNTNKEFYFDLDRYDDIKHICWLEGKAKVLSGILYGRNPETGKSWQKSNYYYLANCAYVF